MTTHRTESPRRTRREQLIDALAEFALAWKREGLPPPDSLAQALDRAWNHPEPRFRALARRVTRAGGSYAKLGGATP